MKDEVVTVVRLPISELAAAAKKRHSIELPLADAKIDADSLVLSFASAPAAAPPSPTPPVAADSGPTKRRRRKAKRHRMKTRGWDVVAKIQNSRGQTAAIYKPLVEALSSGPLTKAQQRAAVANALRKNGNSPTEASVEYYLENTLEYIAGRSGGKETVASA